MVEVVYPYRERKNMFRCLAFVFYISFAVSALGAPLTVDVEAQSAILMNADTGRILFERNAKEKRFPASTTKMATALYAMEQKKLPFDKKISVSLECLLMNDPKKSALGIRSPSYRLDPDGSTMGLRKGEEVSLEALMYGMMFVSGNDAANAIAEVSSGSIEKFVEELNGYVKSIGCENTHFCNPHGLHHPDHMTTAYDLALIMKKAIDVPELRKILSAKSYLCTTSRKGTSRELVQDNRLIRKGKHYYPHAIGGKTGNHSQALRTLVAAAEKEGRRLVVAVLGCKTKHTRYEDAIALFEAAFKEVKEKRLGVRAGSSYSYKIEGASSSLLAALKEDLHFEFYPSEEPKARAFVHWDSLSLPIAKGEKVGEIWIVDERESVLQKAPLFAVEGVKKTFFSSIKSWFQGLFSSKKK